MEKSIETKRLVLRPWREEDAPFMHQWLCRDDIAKACGVYPHASVDDSLAAIRHAEHTPGYRVVTLHDGCPVGAVALVEGTERARAAGTQAELIFWIAAPYRGDGYATEACEAMLEYGFCEMGFDSASCNIVGMNDRPMKTAVRLGFEYAFVERTRLCDGEVTSLVYTVMLKESWTYRHRQR